MIFEISRFYMYVSYTCILERQAFIRPVDTVRQRVHMPSPGDSQLLNAVGVATCLQPAYRPRLVVKPSLGSVSALSLLTLALVLYFFIFIKPLLGLLVYIFLDGSWQPC